MGILAWTWLVVGASFALYIGIAWYSKAKTTGDFYVAERSIPPIMNGMATGADWMSAASFISMAGSDLLSRPGRGHVPHGLDRRLCAAGHAPGPLPAENTASTPCPCSWASATIPTAPG